MFDPPQKKFFVGPHQQIYFGANIRNGREIQCLPYADIFFLYVSITYLSKSE